MDHTTSPQPATSPTPPPPPPPVSAPTAHDLADQLFGASTNSANLSTPASLPTITTDALRAALAEDDVIDDAKMVALLGPDRLTATIDKFEMTLTAANVISAETLAAYKSKVSGRRVFEGSGVTALPILPADTARLAGAIALNTTPAAVGMVIDDPVAVDRVAETLGNRNFEIWLMTAPTFVELYQTLYRDKKVAQLPPVPDIWGVFDELIRQDASDLHLGVGDPPIIRADGGLQRFDTQPVDQEWMKRAVEALTGHDGLTQALERYDADRGFKYGDVKFRINVGADQRGLTLAIRKLSSSAPTMEGLSLPRAVREFTNLERGLVLVTGPTGSGKSTTLAALLGHIGINQARHMITLEDPIEYEIPFKRGRVQQRQLHQSFTSFEQGIRQSLRQDPDVILVGEARDLETIRAAVTAAETGALVFATLHTYDAASTLARIVSAFPEGEQGQIRAQLAYVLKGVLSQTLVPTTTGGRIAAFEILVGTPAVANNLRRPDGAVNIRQVMVTGAKDGMQTIEYHLAQLVRTGKISQAEAEFKARNLEEFHQYLQAGE